MRNNFQVPANAWKTRNGSAEQIEPAPDGNLTQKLPSGLSGALRMREHSRHRPPQKIVWSSDAASWQHAPNIISRASKIPCLSGALRIWQVNVKPTQLPHVKRGGFRMRNNFQVPANVWKTRNGSAEQIEPAPDGNLAQKLPLFSAGALRMRKQPSNARKRLKDIYLRLRELTMHLTGNFPDPHPFNIKNEVNNATPLSSQLAIGGRLTAIGAALPWNSPIVRLPLSVRISLPSYMLWVHYIMQICFCLFCFAVFFPLSPSFYLFFAFSSLSLSSLSFAFPSFFQITAGSLLFASGFFLFCFSLSFFPFFSSLLFSFPFSVFLSFFLLFPLFPFFSSLFLSFFRLFCFAVFFPLSPSFYLFSLFPLFPFL